MPPKVDIKGKRFGTRIVVKEINERRHGRVRWLAKCDCGTTSVLTKRQLEKTKTCQNCKNATFGQMATARKKVRHKATYRSWQSMMTRCFDTGHHAFDRYGGRGISVSERWRNYDNFLDDMGERPKGKTLDRIDVNGDYDCKNCRWATKVQQANNRRDNILLTVDGKTGTLTYWATKSGIARNVLKQRVVVHGWSDKRAVETPVMKRTCKNGY